MNITLVVAQAGIVGAYIILHLWRHEAMNVGAVVAIFQYLLMISQVFYDAAAIYGRLMQRHTDLHSVDGLLEDHARVGRTPSATKAKNWQALEIEHLSFTHHEGEDILHHLRNVRFTIAPGKKIALVGASGAGKTTLLTLLRGLYEAQHVKLALDGAAHKTLAPLAEFTTLVPQDSEIFENTVLYNLTLGTLVPEGFCIRRCA